MKTELMIFAVLAMVASSFLNAENATRVSSQVETTKLRIEKSAQAYAKSQEQKTLATNKAIENPNEG